MPLENIVEEWENAGNNVLYLIKKMNYLGHTEIVICKYFQFNPFPHNNTFWGLWETSLLKTLWEKEKLLITSNFSFSYSVFYLFGKPSSIFVKFEIVVCKLFQFGRV